MIEQSINDVIKFVRKKVPDTFPNKLKVGWMNTGREKYIIITPKRTNENYHPFINIVPIPSSLKIIGWKGGEGFNIYRVKSGNYKFCTIDSCATLNRHTRGVYIIRVFDSRYYIRYSGILFDIDEFKMSLDKGYIKANGSSLEEKMRNVAISLSGLIPYGVMRAMKLYCSQPERVSDKFVLFPVYINSYSIKNNLLMRELNPMGMFQCVVGYFDPFYFVAPFTYLMNEIYSNNESEYIKYLKKMKDKDRKVFRDTLLSAIFGKYIKRGRYVTVVLGRGAKRYTDHCFIPFEGVAVATYDMNLASIVTFFSMFYKETTGYYISYERYIERVEMRILHKPYISGRGIIRVNFRIAKAVFTCLTGLELRKIEPNVRYRNIIVKMYKDRRCNVEKVMKMLNGGERK